jgi:hypothetical protein
MVYLCFSMKRPSLLAAFALASLVGCMNTPAPQNPENASDDESSSSGDKKKNPDAISPDDTSGSSNLLGSGVGTATPRLDKATIKDDSKKDKVSCSGSNIPDLLSIVGESACAVPKATPDNEQPKDVKDSLEIKVTVDNPKVAAGTKANITVTFHNKGKTALPLDFVANPEPVFEVQAFTAKGGRADNPPGSEPALPASVGGEPPEATIQRITLAPNGNAKLVVPWDAVKYKWASAERAKGALPGQHYPRDPAGPLPKGKYVLKVVMPLVGVNEGSDKELSQPKVPVEVGAP